MARKRKAPSSGVDGDPAVGPEPSPSTSSPLEPWRSSRHKPSKPDYTEKTSDDDDSDSSSWTGPPQSGATDNHTDAADADGRGIQRTIKELEKLQRRFSRETKRQMSALETSNKNSGRKEEATKTTAARVARKKQVPAPGLGLPVNSRDSDDGSEYGAVAAKNEAESPSEFVSEVVAERGAARPPSINSSYLPLPWKGRLGYACLNTYLRTSKPSVFCSRTCRMASIIEHRHPLQDPSKPGHPTKNRPDKDQKADAALGHKYVQELGLANARDIVKMLRWNDKYGIKFMRLSSEMFPFASHEEHGYRLAPFASEALCEAGKVAWELGHRLTMHPGQFTQLGSPRKEVIAGSVRDLEYHDELLSLLKLPEQQNRDAIMIIHMGGVFGDKRATLDRFRANYTNLLSPSIKARLVLENDDVSWTVHDLLPVCEELNIPLVLDFHHHNILFDPAHMREGTLDISQPEIMDRILATWRRKGIRPKMHYSEQCAGAVTPRERRKHSPRVMTLPPCPPDMDLMIEAKDKEQAVFELMRTFKLPGYERINDVIPHEREDEDQTPAKVVKAKNGTGKRKRKSGGAAAEEEDGAVLVDVEGDRGRTVSTEEFGMGGPLNRVYWPVGMEAWLKPKKRESNKVKVDVEELL